MSRSSYKWIKVLCGAMEIGKTEALLHYFAEKKNVILVEVKNGKLYIHFMMNEKKLYDTKLVDVRAKNNLRSELTVEHLDELLSKTRADDKVYHFIGVGLEGADIKLKEAIARLLLAY
eukprot:TRINITY_DN6704_c0_g1_i1.p1 TRINITY_DN6704_c0_g1~~TRINITY_DN6704_c0_g1_i1.p1  ORF type:complete len:118 (+),score=36.72 TRINITY_DN6704_c0_g1_i1:717-1070(+)